MFELAWPVAFSSLKTSGLIILNTRDLALFNERIRSRSLGNTSATSLEATNSGCYYLER